MFSSNVDAGWNAPGKESDRFTAFALQSPVGADCPTERADGTVIAASRLGSVLMRSKQGAWRIVRGPGIESLLCVLPVDLPEAELLAVGEFGTLLRKPRGQDKLVPVNTGNLPPGTLLNIAGTPASGWIVAHQAAGTVTLFRSTTLEGGSWTPLYTEKLPTNRYVGPGFFMWHTPGGMAFAVARGEIRYLDYASGQWSTRYTHNRMPVSAMTVSPKGDIGAFLMLGAIITDFVSHDNAQTWQQIKPANNLKQVPALTLNDGSLLMVNGGMNKEVIQISRDNGQTWSAQDSYPHGRTILPLKSGALLDFDKGQYGFFSIRHSGDLGANWKTEYSTFNAKAYERQEKDNKK
jgi:hypothetical protein